MAPRRAPDLDILGWTGLKQHGGSLDDEFHRALRGERGKKLLREMADNDPIVGTSLDYFAFRGLRVERGRQMTRLGDCVVGAAVAEHRGLAPGGHVISSPESVFNLAGVYPLKMRVTGILAPAGTPDDDAIFVDVRTAWVIEGLAHGHTDLSKPGAAGQVLKREGNVVVGFEFSPEGPLPAVYHNRDAGQFLCPVAQ